MTDKHAELRATMEKTLEDYGPDANVATPGLLLRLLDEMDILRDEYDRAVGRDVAYRHGVEDAYAELKPVLESLQAEVARLTRELGESQQEVETVLEQVAVLNDELVKIRPSPEVVSALYVAVNKLMEWEWLTAPVRRSCMKALVWLDLVSKKKK